MFLSCCLPAPSNGYIELAPDLSVSIVRYANAAGLGNAFEPGRNVHLVAKYIIAFDSFGLQPLERLRPHFTALRAPGEPIASGAPAAAHRRQQRSTSKSNIGRNM
jgi:hypothetical protein